jgi:hypothetical protein
MPVFTKAHAQECAKKLKAKPENETLPRLVVKEVRGGAHIIEQIWCNDRLINKFGIKHGSNRNASHGWVARDLGLRPQRMFEFAVCTMTVDEMIEHFVDQVSSNCPADKGFQALKVWAVRSPRRHGPLFESPPYRLAIS